jgi:hypothetical protein
MHSTMRAYDGLALETTHGCVGRIAQRSRGSGSENSLTQATRGHIAVMPCRIELSANEIVSANKIESVVDN